MSIHPQYILIMPGENGDRIFHVTYTERQELEKCRFVHYKESLQAANIAELTHPFQTEAADESAIKITHRVSGLNYLTGTDYEPNVELRHQILHYVLDHATWQVDIRTPVKIGPVIKLQEFTKHCRASDKMGNACALVMSSVGKTYVLNVIYHREEDYLTMEITPITENTLYQNGRLITQAQLEEQLRESMERKLAVVNNLFTATSLDGFKMPSVD